MENSTQPINFYRIPLFAIKPWVFYFQRFFRRHLWTNFRRHVRRHLQKNPKKNHKGQIILEALWLMAFCCAFLTVLSYIYEKGEKEIRTSRKLETSFITKNPSQ